jgi:predicted glycosyltransferase
MVYSHDAFGLGNIKRMLAISQYLLSTFDRLSILVISGSPALHSLRLPPGLDYIKLPCLARDELGKLGVKYLDAGLDETVRLRSDLILTAVKRFQPDLFLVDKKPYGLLSELQEALSYLSTNCPDTALVLLLRDILDRSDVTVQQWERGGYYEAIASLYQQVWVVGSPDIFDLPSEYHFSPELTQKVRFCGYIRRATSVLTRSELRRQLHLQPDDQLILVTPGGGGDGYRLVDTYLSSINILENRVGLHLPKSLIVCGPEMPATQQDALYRRIGNHPAIELREFSDHLTAWMGAADLVVSMAGYNTICEILSFGKRAIAIPRIVPVEEQWIRAERMAALGLLQAIHPDQLTPERLANLIATELAQPQLLPPRDIDLNALPRIAQLVADLLKCPLSGLTSLYAQHSAAYIPSMYSSSAHYLPITPCLITANP